MDRAKAQYICRSAAEATARLRDVFRVEMEMLAVLDHFWCLQDQLSRLLNSVSDNPREFFTVQEEAYSFLFTDVVDVLRLVANSRFIQIAAVKQSCKSINNLLTEVTNLRTSEPAVTRFHVARNGP